MRKPKFDLIIFDMDGVLADTSTCHLRAFADLWNLIGVDGPPYETIAGRKTNEVVSEIAVSLGSSARQIRQWVTFKQERARMYLASESIAYADSRPCLEATAARGLQLGLGTGASRETTLIVLRQLGVATIFPIIATADDVNRGKPAPDVYLQIMQKAAVDAANTLIIEDSVSGLQAALAAQAYVASVRTGNQVDDERFIGSYRDLRGPLRYAGVEAP